jgi:uncharacterized protein (DUF983 family)
MSDIPVVTTIYVQADYVECPHCGAHQDGWVNDPRGAEETCDECGEPYKVHNDADLEITP